MTKPTHGHSSTSDSPKNQDELDRPSKPRSNMAMTMTPKPGAQAEFNLGAAYNASNKPDQPSLCYQRSAAKKLAPNLRTGTVQLDRL